MLWWGSGLADRKSWRPLPGRGGGWGRWCPRGAPRPLPPDSDEEGPLLTCHPVALAVMTFWLWPGVGILWSLGPPPPRRSQGRG